jgi:hypothetical protein
MSASNTETETETGSPDQQPECEFDADDLDIFDFVRVFQGLEEWECSRPVWEESSGNRCVWHASDGQTQAKPPAELEKTVDAGDLHGSAATGGDLSKIDFPMETGFIDADLSGATLSDADLSATHLAETEFQNSTLSRGTDIDSPGKRIRQPDSGEEQSTDENKSWVGSRLAPIHRLVELVRNNHTNEEETYDRIARANHVLREAYSANGLISRTREARFRE